MGAQAKSNSTASIAIYVILGLLLAFVVFYIVWKIMKKKLLKKKELKVLRKKEEETKKVYYDYVMSFYKIIEYAENELKNFVPSIGSTKMKDIKNGANKLTAKLLKREDFSKSFADNKVYENFLEHATKIASYNCNLWESNIPETVQFFKDEYKLIPESEHKTEYLNLVEQSIRRQYYEKQQD